jgi:hypothetical protein
MDARPALHDATHGAGRLDAGRDMAEGSRISVTVALEALLTLFGLEAFNAITKRRMALTASRSTIIIVAWVLFLIIPIVADAILWATLYYFSGMLATFEEALYFSTVTFTTVGYGDIVPSPDWRLLATFEAVNGWIIFGWMTALIIAAIQRLPVWPADAFQEIQRRFVFRRRDKMHVNVSRATVSRQVAKMSKNPVFDSAT